MAELVTSGPEHRARTRNQDTDLGPVTLTVTLTQLRTIDEVPCPAAFNAAVNRVTALRASLS